MGTLAEVAFPCADAATTSVTQAREEVDRLQGLATQLGGATVSDGVAGAACLAGIWDDCFPMFVGTEAYLYALVLTKHGILAAQLLTCLLESPSLLANRNGSMLAELGDAYTGEISLRGTVRSKGLKVSAQGDTRHGGSLALRTDGRGVCSIGSTHTTPLPRQILERHGGLAGRELVRSFSSPFPLDL